MRRVRMLRGGAAVTLIGVSVLVATACGDDRIGFGAGPGPFNADAGADSPTCGFRCSLDRRSVIQTCTGEVVETCPEALACGEARCQEPCAAAAADRSSNGCEFYFQSPRFEPTWPQSCYAAFVVNTSNLPAALALESEGSSVDVSRSMYQTNPGDTNLIQHNGTIAPGDSVILFVSDRDPKVVRPPDGLGRIGCPPGVVPAVLAESPLPTKTGFGSAFRLKTNVPVGVTTMYPFGGAASYLPSAMLLLPVATWAKESIIVNGWEMGRSGSPSAHILASEDDTEVTILPTRDLQGGGGVEPTPAKVPRTYRLDKGQLLQLVQGDELSGSIVSSTKPTSIVGGHSCADVPVTASACDTLAQQLPGFEQWGSEYVGVGYRPRVGNERETMAYRIVAARDGTRLDYDPDVPSGAPITMSAGEVVTFYSGTGEAFVVRTQDAEHPIYLGALMQSGGTDTRIGSGFGGSGDPEFVNVVPSGQYLNAYSFYADPTYAETSLVIVRAKSDGKFSDVWLECAGKLTEFRPIGTRGEYEFTRVDLARSYGPGQTFGSTTCQAGLQRMRSDGPFTATVWGWDIYASYAYPGGMAQRRLVESPLVPVN